MTTITLTKSLRCPKCKTTKQEGVYLRSYNLRICKECFVEFFKDRVETTIRKFKMFKKDDKVLVAISGGKDSVALAKALKELNYNITLLHVYTGIKEKNYAEDSMKVVKEFAEKENLPLKILNLQDEIGVDIKTASKLAKKELCAVCGMIKRYILNREAKDFDVVVTGHNLDDEASTALSSFIFWKEFIKRQWPVLYEEETLQRKAKPLTLISENETRLFCEVLKLPFNSTACPLRGGPYLFFKNFIHQLDAEMPSSVLCFYKGFLKRKKEIFPEKESSFNLKPCSRCGYLTMLEVCSFCKLKEKIKNLKEAS